MAKRKRSVDSDDLSATPASPTSRSTVAPSASSPPSSLDTRATPLTPAHHRQQAQYNIVSAAPTYLSPSARSSNSSDSSNTDAPEPSSPFDLGLMTTQLRNLNIATEERDGLVLCPGVAQLLDQLTEPYDVSPASKKTATDIVNIAKETKTYREATALEALEQFFGYRPGLPFQGTTELLFRDKEQQWR